MQLLLFFQLILDIYKFSFSDDNTMDDQVYTKCFILFYFAHWLLRAIMYDGGRSCQNYKILHFRFETTWDVLRRTLQWERRRRRADERERTSKALVTFHSGGSKKTGIKMSIDGVC